MFYIKNTFFLSLLIVIYLSVFTLAQEAVKIDPEDSIVLVISSHPEGLEKRSGNGFVIGDGTLVVTAQHLVFGESEQGGHRMPGLIMVFSPYLGDACYGEIIASNRELDLAIIKVSWLGHPGLKLADDDRITDLEEIEFIGMSAVIINFASDVNEPFEEGFSLQHERLPIDFVAVRRRIPQFISLSGVGELGSGWSGSPMLISGTSDAAGCFVRVLVKGQEPTSAQGPAISYVKRFVEKNGQKKSLIPMGKILLRPSNGTEVFLLALKTYQNYSRDEYDLAFKHTQELMVLRSESAFIYNLAAGAAEKQNKTEQAEQYYQKALELNPESITAKIYYAQFLSERQSEKALDILQQLWQFEEAKQHVALLMNNILFARGEYKRCSEFLNEAIKINPDNAYLWFSLGASQFYMGETDNSVTSMARAVELFPERGPFRGQLARMMEQTGKLDEAEKHFRELLNIEPENPVVHFWLAQFLAKHKPEAKDEALKEAQFALNLPANGRIPKQIIEELITELQSHTEQESSK
jgi:tetratricopeptide (TPR) repeat protein